MRDPNLIHCWAVPDFMDLEMNSVRRIKNRKYRGSKQTFERIDHMPNDTSPDFHDFSRKQNGFLYVFPLLRSGEASYRMRRGS